MGVKEKDGLLVERLAVDRGGRAVLRDLSFHLPSGAAMMLTGNNGAGKSTLLRALAGLIPRLEGTIDLLLAPGDRVEVAEHAHYLGHASGLKLSLTAGENIAFYADWDGSDGATPQAALGAVGLAHLSEIPVSVLSAGQRRRVALARLLVSRRPLWLLDEPATALDTESEAWLSGLLRHHIEAGGMLIAAIHSPLDLPARALRLGAA